MRKAMWPLVVALGLILAIGTISGGNFSPKNAEAGIQTVVTDDANIPAVWWFDSLGDFDQEDACDQEDDDGNPINLVAMLQDDETELDENDVITLYIEGQNEVWICVELDEEGRAGGNADYDEVDFDSDDYGSWEEALCAAETSNDEEFEDEDVCEDTSGLGTDSMQVLCNTPDLDSECQADGGSGDVAALFVCEDEAGVANVTISHDIDGEEGDSPDLVQFRIICWNEADDGEITCVPCKVEIVPALGSTQYSLIYVTLLDEDGNAAAVGAEVTWLTDNCEISDDPIADILTDEDEDLDTFDEIIDIFEEYEDNPNPENSDDLHDFVNDWFDPDWDDENEDETFLEEPFDTDDEFDDMDTFTAVVLNCGQGHDSKPGIATVTALVEVIDNPDLVFEIDVTVVGPPAGPLVVAADPSGSVRCGERVQITVTVKDAKGQNVSDHTLVEAITNFGGVLGGTGAVAGQQGLVTPVSSTLAETFNGVATFWLLTSETHSGPYEVVISTGGGGAAAGFFGTDDNDNFDDEDSNDEASDEKSRDASLPSQFDFDDEAQYQPTLGGSFSTPVVNGRVQVACTIPAAAAPAPAATVRAPSTGQGIIPPNTGDAGLADASGSSSMLFVIAGVAVFALAGVAGVKLAHR